MAEARRRLAPEARRELILDAAETIFARTGYAHSGLAEIADVAEVSKTLLYHYFPDGRPELYAAVIARRGDQMAMDLGRAASGPADPEVRIGRLVDGLIGFFDEDPNRYRLLIVEPWGSREPEVIGRAAGVRMLVVELVIAATGSVDIALESAMVGATAAVGSMFALCELHATGSIPRHETSALAQAFVIGGLRSGGLL